MNIKNYLIIVFTFSCVWLVSSELNLTEDSPCVTDGYNGTCVNVYKCNSAASTYLLSNAGFRSRGLTIFPKFPEVCSYKNNEPIVCCTDCYRNENETKRDEVMLPMARFTKKDGSVGRTKCLEYFQRLPYPCRGTGNIQIEKYWNEKKKCSDIGFGGALGVGGRDARRWEFPHAALLGYGTDVESAQWLCGASVISERFILTAAHCSGTRALGNVTFAALGLLKRTDPKKYWKIHKIKRIIIHPEYKAPSKYHDIALLETENEINFGRDLLPACLDTGHYAHMYTPYTEASGWGRLGHGKDLADTMQVVYLDKFNESECRELYRPHRLLKDGYDPEKQMCYGSHDEIIDTCQGDSGGPLQINDFKCLYIVIGVTSYGKDCGILGSAGMYTRVSYYVPWIESIVWPEETEAQKKKDNEWLERWFH